MYNINCNHKLTVHGVKGMCIKIVTISDHVAEQKTKGKADRTKFDYTITSHPIGTEVPRLFQSSVFQVCLLVFWWQ